MLLIYGFFLVTNWYFHDLFLHRFSQGMFFVMLIRFFFLFSLQQRAKENREARKRMITDEYRFIMGIVGGFLDLEVSAIEEFIVDSEEVFEFL